MIKIKSSNVKTPIYVTPPNSFKKFVYNIQTELPDYLIEIYETTETGIHSSANIPLPKCFLMGENLEIVFNIKNIRYPDLVNPRYHCVVFERDPTFNFNIWNYMKNLSEASATQEEVNFIKSIIDLEQSEYGSDRAVIAKNNTTVQSQEIENRNNESQINKIIESINKTEQAIVQTKNKLNDTFKHLTAGQFKFIFQKSLQANAVDKTINLVEEIFKNNEKAKEFIDMVVTEDGCSLSAWAAGLNNAKLNTILSSVKQIEKVITNNESNNLNPVFDDKEYISKTNSQSISSKPKPSNLISFAVPVAALFSGEYYSETSREIDRGILKTKLVGDNGSLSLHFDLDQH